MTLQLPSSTCLISPYAALSPETFTESQVQTNSLVTASSSAVAEWQVALPFTDVQISGRQFGRKSVCSTLSSPRYSSAVNAQGGVCSPEKLLARVTGFYITLSQGRDHKLQLGSSAILQITLFSFLAVAYFLYNFSCIQ